MGNVRLYAAGNAANGDGRNSGDRIYTTSLELSPAAASGAAPQVSDVVNGASFEPTVSQSTWITIRGTNLASNTRTWTAEELASGALPQSLDGTSATINGKPASIYYISPTQLNILAPADDSAGPVEVKVTTSGQASAATAVLSSMAPAFFTFDGKYLAATHADNSLLGKSGLFSSAPTATTPAKPGETVVLYGTGFGATTPAVPSGRLTSEVSPLSNSVSITIGGAPAAVSFAGLVPPFAGLYQLNVVVPASVADGDQLVEATILGARTPSSTTCCFVTVQR